MAQRRMFSDKIVDTDAFLDMGTGSQLLYFHLCMRADDDGFVSNPKKIMRMIGSQDDDFKILLAKRFVIQFESGVCVIKHWLIHNLLRIDRYKETQYVKEKKMLVVDEETRKYSLIKPNNEVWQPNGNQMAPQVRLGKVSIDKEGVFSEKNIPSSKTISNFRDQRRIESGREVMAKKITTPKQKKVLARLDILDRYHEKALEYGFNYLEEEDEQANNKYQGLSRPFIKRYKTKEEQDEVMEWFFTDQSMAYANGHPSNFFSVSTWLSFDNRKNKKGGVVSV